MIVVPARMSSDVVEREQGAAFRCPLCRASHTREECEIEWVAFPLPDAVPATICLGCCIDIYNTCRVSDFYSHPYFEIVEEAANHFGLPVGEFRDHCLRQQLVIMRESPDQYTGRENEALRLRLERLLLEGGSQESADGSTRQK